jgi:hypothetical protein
LSQPYTGVEFRPAVLGNPRFFLPKCFSSPVFPDKQEAGVRLSGCLPFRLKILVNTTDVGSDMTLKTIDELKGLDLVMPDWESWQHHPNSDFCHFRLVCSVRQDTFPHVVVIEEGGSPRALVAGRIEKTCVAPTLGYLKLGRMTIRSLTVIHEGALGRLESADGARIADHWNELLRGGKVDAIVLHQVREESPLLDAAVSHISRWRRDSLLKWSVHRSMKITQEKGFLEARMRSKHRSWVRKKLRELESSFPGRVVWTWVDRFEEVDELCREIEAIAAATYQRGLGAGFVNNAEQRQRYRLFAARRQLRVCLLKIDNKIRAFWIGIKYGDTFHSDATGYDPGIASFEPGTLLFLRMIDALVEEGTRDLDFGLGDAFYKERFADRSWRETNVRIFAPTLKGLFLCSVLKAVNFADLAARRLVEKTRLSTRLKTSWRRRLRGAAAKAKS